MQLVFPWAPKLARKCESRHWFPSGADGRSYGHVITKFSRMGRLPHFLTYGAPPTLARFARGWSSAINLPVFHFFIPVSFVLGQAEKEGRGGLNGGVVNII